jgi:pantothenate kinase-related protein Tda10
MTSLNDMADRLFEATEELKRLRSLVVQYHKDYQHMVSRRHEAEVELREVKAKYASSIEEIAELNYAADNSKAPSPFPHSSED